MPRRLRSRGFDSPTTMGMIHTVFASQGPSAGDSLAAGGPRSDHPRDVIPGPSAGDSLAAGDIDLPEEVANDELDDLFVDVTTASPKKEDRSLAKKRIGEKRNTFACSWGPPLQISRPT